MVMNRELIADFGLGMVARADQIAGEFSEFQILTMIFTLR
jgi:hypothetical protein